MIMPLLILFFLGLLQAAIGWIMVASGLTGDALYVKPTKLALHFIFAIGSDFLCFLVFTKITIPGNPDRECPMDQRLFHRPVGACFYSAFIWRPDGRKQSSGSCTRLAAHKWGLGSGRPFRQSPSC